MLRGYAKDTYLPYIKTWKSKKIGAINEVAVDVLGYMPYKIWL